MLLEIHIINLKIIWGKKLAYKLKTGSLKRKLIADYPESMKDELYLAKIQHPAEILDDVRHLCDLLSAFFKLSSHTVAFAYVPAHLQTAPMEGSHMCIPQDNGSQISWDLWIMLNSAYNAPTWNRLLTSVKPPVLLVWIPCGWRLAHHGH